MFHVAEIRSNARLLQFARMRDLARRTRACAWVRCRVQQCVLVGALLLASAIFAQPEPESGIESEEEWNVTRKRMRDQQFENKAQQSY